MLGKGGSAIATPILVALGVPPMVAVTAPLPATVPASLVAADRYRREDLVDRDILLWALLAGFPATVVGALVTRWVSGDILVLMTDAVIVGLGVRLLVRQAQGGDTAALDDEALRRRTVVVAAVTGLAAGLLAN